jgi:paraquat-inducible protein A
MSAEPDKAVSGFAAGSAARLGLAACPACKQIAAVARHTHCPRCGSALHLRIPESVTRSWAFLVAALVLYIPANVLPIMVTTSLGDTQSNTIMSGIIVLWGDGSWGLALIVFIASMVVPLGKIFAITVLLFSVQRRPLGSPKQLSRLYHLVELVGKWSMLDVYVVTLLTAVVRFDAFMSVHVGNGALAFGGVVVMTMLSAQAFDPRLIWDAAPDLDKGLARRPSRNREAKNDV